MYPYVSKALKAPPSSFDVEDVLDLGFRVQGLGASGLPFADARPLELQCFGFGNYLTGRFSKHSPIVSRARAQRAKRRSAHRGLQAKFWSFRMEKSGRKNYRSYSLGLLMIHRQKHAQTPILINPFPLILTPP